MTRRWLRLKQNGLQVVNEIKFRGTYAQYDTANILNIIRLNVDHRSLSKRLLATSQDAVAIKLTTPYPQNDESTDQLDHQKLRELNH